MNRDRVRKISLVGLLILAVAAFAYFALIQRQARHETAMGRVATAKDVYYCPMHKTYHADKPGNCPICSMKLVKLEGPGTAAATEVAAKVEPMAGVPTAPSTPAPGSQDNAIFVAPEKQQLIGMRSVKAEIGTLTKDIRIVGKVSYDETRLTHIHSKGLRVH